MYDKILDYHLKSRRNQFIKIFSILKKMSKAIMCSNMFSLSLSPFIFFNYFLIKLFQQIYCENI